MVRHDFSGVGLPDGVAQLFAPGESLPNRTEEKKKTAMLTAAVQVEVDS